MNFLILGAGSIGKRHIKNISTFLSPENIFVVEPVTERKAEIAKVGVPLNNIFSGREEALAMNRYQGAIIATPTSMHYEIALALISHDIALMIEKPLGVDASLANDLETAAQKNNTFIFTAYCFRFDPVANKFNQLLKSGLIGDILYARAEMSTYLPEWHPHEDYRDFYMAKKKLGGGTLLDQSHLYDMALWFFGDIASVFGISKKFSDLEIDTDDFGEFIFKMKSGLHLSIHIDLFTRPWREFFMVSGTKGTLTWDIHTRKIIHEDTNKNQNILMVGNDYNQMYINEIKYFIDQVRERKVEGPGYKDGKRVVEIIDAIRASSKEERVIALA